MRREGSRVRDSQLHQAVDGDASQREGAAYGEYKDSDSLHPTVDY